MEAGGREVRKRADQLEQFAEQAKQGQVEQGKHMLELATRCQQAEARLIDMQTELKIKALELASADRAVEAAEATAAKMTAKAKAAEAAAATAKAEAADIGTKFIGMVERVAAADL